MKKFISVLIVVSVFLTSLPVVSYAAGNVLYEIDFEQETADSGPTVGEDKNILSSASNAAIISEDDNLYVRAMNTKTGTAYAAKIIEEARRSDEDDKSVIMMFDIKSPDLYAVKDIRLYFAPVIASTATPVSVTIMQIVSGKLLGVDESGALTREILDMTDGEFKRFLMKYDDETKDYSVYCEGSMITSGNIFDLSSKVETDNLLIYQLGFYNVSNKRNNPTGGTSILDVDNIVIQKNDVFSAALQEEDVTLMSAPFVFSQPVDESYINKENITVDGYAEDEYELIYDKSARKLTVEFVKALEIDMTYTVRMNNIYSQINEPIAVTEYEVVGLKAITAEILGDANNVNPVLLEIVFSRAVLPECLTADNISVNNVSDENITIESREEDEKTYMSVYFEKPLYKGTEYRISFSDIYGYAEDLIGTKELSFYTMSNDETKVSTQRTFESSGKIADAGDTPDVGVRLWTKSDYITDTVEPVDGSSVWHLKIDAEDVNPTVSRGIYTPMNQKSIASCRIKLSENASGSIALRTSSWSLDLCSFKDNTLSGADGEFAKGIYNKWLNFVFVFDGKTVSLGYNGKLIYKNKEVKSYDMSIVSTEFRITMNHTQGQTDDMFFDDYYCYVPGLTNTSVSEIQTADDVVISFTNPIDEETITTGAFEIDGMTEYTAYLGDDSKSVHLNMADGLEPGRDYTLKLSKKILDMTGNNVYSEKGYRIRTKEIPEGLQRVTYYLNYGTENVREIPYIEAGTVSIEVVFSNTSATDKTEYILFGLYDEETGSLIAMCGGKTAMEAKCGKKTAVYNLEVPSEACRIDGIYVKDIANPYVYKISDEIKMSLKNN